MRAELFCKIFFQCKVWTHLIKFCSWNLCPSLKQTFMYKFRQIVKLFKFIEFVRQDIIYEHTWVSTRQYVCQLERCVTCHLSSYMEIILNDNKMYTRSIKTVVCVRKEKERERGERQRQQVTGLGFRRGL